MKECRWIVDDMSADYLCVTHGCFTLGRAFDHDLCEIARLRAQVKAVRDVLGDVSNVYAPSGVSPLVNVSLILEALDGAK